MVYEIHRYLNVDKTYTSVEDIGPIYLRRGESGLTQIVGHLIKDGQPFDATGYTATFRAYNGAGRWVISEASVSKDTVTYTVDAALTASAGDISIAHFFLTKDDGIVTTSDMPIVVKRNVDVSDQEAKEYQNAIEKTLEELNAYRSTLDAAVKASQTAVTNANAATSKANTAASNADTKAAAANTAATAANTAAGKANTATTAANNAATAANNAAGSVNTAIENANQAVSDLNKKVAAGDFNGATFTPAVSTYGDLSWSNDKKLANPKTVNIKGPQGDGVKPLDAYATLQELQAAHPSGNKTGDGYMVGTNYYFWNGSEWKDGGPLQNGMDLYIHVEVDSDGNVWATYPDDVNHPDLELADGCLWVVCDGSRVNLGQVRGTKIFTGTGAPGSIQGQLKDDLYIDTTSKALYKLGTTWAQIATL